MPLTRMVRAEASADHHRMTLKELRDFVAECDRAELGDALHVDVRTRGLGHLSAIWTVAPGRRGRGQ